MKPHLRLVTVLLACTSYFLSAGADAEDAELALIEAVSVNDTNTVQAFIDKGVDINWRFGSVGETLLQRAAFWGQSAVVRTLLAAGADPLATNTYGGTAFQIAAEYGKREVAEILLQHGAQFDSRDAVGRTALLLSAKSGIKGTEDIALWLLRLGADPNVQAKNSNETVMFGAVYSGKTRLLEALVNQDVRSVGKGQEGWSALHVAVLFGDTNTVKMLLRAGCNVDPVDNHGFTPLLLGVRRGDGDQTVMVDLLVRAGADVNKRDMMGRSILELAQQRVKKAEKGRGGSISEARELLERVEKQFERQEFGDRRRSRASKE